MKIKPFRLLNAKEILHINTLLQTRLSVWNDKYALSFLQCAVMKPTHRPVTCEKSKHLSLIQMSAFGEINPFYELSAKLLFKALIQALQIEKHYKKECAFHDDNTNADWFYKGSPTLVLHLKVNEWNTTLHLAPNWVMENLPKRISNNPPLNQLDDAISSETIECDVILPPFICPLSEIRYLSCGHVIKTDHRVDEPLQLNAQALALAKVTLGKQQQHKSIRIMS